MTKSVTVKIVNGFVSDGAGDNPAGVVLDARKIFVAKRRSLFGATRAKLSG
jgi:hypothetical protein